MGSDFKRETFWLNAIRHPSSDPAHDLAPVPVSDLPAELLRQ